ncbi:MAG: hypothetical protein OXF77_05310 [Thaumarchaeota archaeon]|nr:hypothetical protein [Nitrososphaerota archaeon]
MKQSNLIADDSSRDNITDWALDIFQTRYGENITKDDIWDYMYGVMHAKDWRKKYKHDLQRELPRIPLAEDFASFVRGGGNSCLSILDTKPAQKLI